MANISVLIDAKVAGLGEVGALDASVQKLGVSATGLGTSLDKTTGSLNVAGEAHAATAREAQALEADLARATAQSDLAGAAHTKTAAAAQSLGTSMGQAAVQAETMGVQTDGLTAKLGALQSAQALGGVEAAAATSTVALEDLSAATAASSAAATSSTSAMAASTVAVTDLAAVDANLLTGKKASAKATEEESAALEKAQAAHEAHAEAVMKGVAATGEFGKAGVEASEKLGTLAGILGPAGGISAGLAGVVVGLGAGVAVAKAGIESFNSMGESVLQLQHITGMTAESSSRLIDVFAQLGLGTDVVDKAMFSLAHRTEELGGKIPTTEKTLAELGVTVAKNADGTTDLTKTLLNVADAYNSAGTGADKDAIAYAAFGKQGQALIPVLEQGSAGLRSMSDNAQRVFDQQQLEQVKQYNIEMERSGQEIDRLKDSIGGALVPAIGDLAQKWNDEIPALEAAGRAGKEHQTILGLDIKAMVDAGDAALHMESASRKNAQASSDEAAALKKLNDELAAEEQDRQAILDQDNAAVEASLRLQHAAATVANAQKALGDELVKDSEYATKHQAAVDRVAAAQAKYNDTLKAYGPQAAQTKAAQDALNASLDASKTLDQQNSDAATSLADKQLALKDAMLADSIAARDAAEKQAELAGGHLSAAQQAGAQAAELQKLKDQAGGVLPAELQKLLDQLNAFHDVSVSVTANLAINDPSGFWGAAHPGRQHGGAVEGGRIYRVGESGPEWMIAPPGGGYVFPNGVTPPAVGGNAASSSWSGTSSWASGTSSMDDTNELIAAAVIVLHEISDKLTGAPFANRAYGRP